MSSGRVSVRSSVGLLSQLAVVGALVAAAVAVLVGRGPELAHDLRERLLQVTPFRALVAGIVFALVFGVWSIAAGGRSPPRPRPTTYARVPVVALLGLIVVAASTFRLLLVRAATAPSVLGDELVYSGLAKGFALDRLPLFRGELDLAHSLLYPLLVSPGYVFTDDGARAFETTKAINAIVVTSVAVPAYLLARRVAGPGLALGVAALAAFEPWTAYASLTMTESLFLPAFTTFVFLLSRMLERPAIGRQLAVLAALVLLIGIRPQAFALVTALVVAIGMEGVRAPPLARMLRAYAFLLVALGAGAVATALALAAGVSTPGAGVADVIESLFDPVGLVKWSLWNVAVYELALGVVALAVFPLALHRLLLSPDERTRATGTALLTSALAVLVSVAAVSASPSGLDILHERYLFYLTPLVLVGLAYWLQMDLVMPRRVAWIAAIGAVALAASLPSRQIARANMVDSPTAAWVQTLQQSMTGVPTKVLVVGLAAVGALVLVCFRRPVVPILAVALPFAALVCWLDFSAPISVEQDRRLAWVDRALPRDGRASLVHLGYSRPDQPCGAEADWEQQGFVVWTEFFNTRVDRVFHVGQQVERDNLSSPSLTIGAGGIVLDGGRPFAPKYAVLDSRQPVVGTRLAQLDLSSLGTQYQAGASLALWKVEPPLRFLVHAQPLPPRADGGEC